MKAPQHKRNSYTLIGLLVAFFMSAVVIPAFSASTDFDNSTKLHITSTGDSHSSPATPLPLPEEEKEEESRADKNHTLDFAVVSIVYELSAATQNGPTTWEFNHSNASALTNFPIYLSKHSLLI